MRVMPNGEEAGLSHIMSGLGRAAAFLLGAIVLAGPAAGVAISPTNVGTGVSPTNVGTGVSPTNIGTGVAPTNVGGSMAADTGVAPLPAPGTNMAQPGSPWADIPLADAAGVQPVLRRPFSIAAIFGETLTDMAFATTLATGAGLGALAGIVRQRHRRRIGWGVLPDRQSIWR
jgi:hypothetical protein